VYIIIVGGGKVGYYLTKTLLSEGHEVLLIERDPDKTEQFVEQFGSVVVAGDGAEAAVMAAAGAARADVVIAVTGEDEDNLVICQVAKSKFHVGRTIARVNNPKNEHLFRMLGVDITVSQTDYILTLIEQAIPNQPFMHLVNLIHEDMAIVDAKVVTDSQIAGRQIGDLPVPENCIIAAIVRAGELIIPSATTTVQEGDDLIAITHRSVEEDLRKLLM
jgi:trk system potassium uptake protein TrkA